MTVKEAEKIAGKLGGWREGEVFRFPTPYLANRFERIIAGIDKVPA